MTNLFKLLFHRVFWVAIGIAVQAAALVVMIYRFQQYFVYFYGISLFISMVAVGLQMARARPVINRMDYFDSLVPHLRWHFI